MRMRGSRNEISTVGFDPNLQGVGGDFDGAGYSAGINVPLITELAPGTGITNRFFFMLARMRLGAFEKARLVGIRQFVEIGTKVSTGETPPRFYPINLGVTSPFWRFTDGNISWHLRRVPPTYQQTANLANKEGFQFLDSQTPALLYSTYTDGLPPLYTPPAKIPGVPLIGALGTFYSLQWNWKNDHAYFSMDTEIQGPCDIVLFASVLQTNPDTRTPLVFPGPVVTGTSLPPEDGFLLNFPSATYTRIGGSLLFQKEEFYGEPAGQLECWSANDGPRPINTDPSKEK